MQVERSADQIMDRIARMKDSSDFADIFRNTCIALSTLGMQSKVFDLIIYQRKTGEAQIWTYGQVNNKENQLWHFNVPKLKSKHYLDGLEAWRNRRKLRQIHLKGNLAKGYYRQLIKSSNENSLPTKFIDRINELHPAYHTEYYFLYGLFRTVTKSPLKKDKVLVLRRFSKVLEHAFTRFLDLQKAETLSRELEIEVALEKVRHRTMAMTESTELAGTVEILYQQLLDLGVDAERIVICFPDLKEGIAEVWMTGVSGSRIEKRLTIVLDEPTLIDKVIQAWEKKKKSTVIQIGGQDLEAYLQFTAKSFGTTIPVPSHKGKRVFSVANFSKGFINVIGTSTLNPADILLLERFAGVFEQTYTRFLDLKKAEEQAREAQIEAALERVRSRTMAMYKSDELNEVITLVFKELRALDIFMHGAMVYLFDDPDEGFSLWLQDSAFSFAKIVQFTLMDHPFFNSLIKAKDSAGKILTDLLNKREKDRFFEFSLEHSDLQHVTEERKQFVLSKPGYSRSIAATRHAAMAIDNFDQIIYTDEENKILLRFAKVFEQTYTRFIDLKNAEAQTREARIEASLERIRSRSMAMQKSDELADVSEVLFREMRTLGSDAWACGIVLCSEGGDLTEHWMSVEGGKLSRVQVPVDLDHIHRSMYNAWLEKEQLFTLEIGGDELIRHYERMMTIPVLKENINQATQKQFKAPKWQKNHVASFTYGYLLVVSLIDSKGSDIYPRFAKVFEQSYTRFLDLKKAEEQAREAQIEAALERVRSASMAMHASEEMPSVAIELFQQLFKLGICIDAISIDIPEPDVSDLIVWGATSDYQYDFSLRLPYFDCAVIKCYRNAIENQIETFSDQFDKQEKNRFIQHVIDQTPMKENDEDLHLRFRSLLDAESYNRSVAIQYIYPKQSSTEGTPQIIALWMANYQGHSYTESEEEILKRFSLVFAQAYTRFLDLKKAEAQAREAQIEAALERVRSRTLAMHKSQELTDVAEITFKQLISLNLLIDGFGIDIFKDYSGDFRIWSATPEHIYPTELFIPYIDTPIMNNVLEARRNRVKVLVDHIPKDEIRAYYRHCLSNTVMKDITPEERKEKVLQSNGLDRVMSINEHTGLFIFNFQFRKYTEEDVEMIRRFGQVFEQSYIRFLDLQKAETQAHEAKIETALERVRSRSMAMHKSSEIGQVVVLIYRELRTLGFTDYMNCGYIEIDESQHIQKAWMTNMGADFQENFTLPLTGDPVLDERYKNWKQGKPYFHQEVGGETLRAHIEFVAPQMQSSKWAAITRQDLPDPTHFNNANFSHGYLQLETAVQLDPQDISLLIRFTQVFEQTYTRFLDLLKAEELTRETARQAALDRVRAEISSMRTSEDLQQITPVIWKELQVLQVPFFRCGTFIIDKAAKMLHAYLATPDGKPVAALHLHSDHSPFVQNAWQSWQRQEIYIEKWSRTQFEQWTESLLKLKQIDDATQYQLGKSAPNILVLQLLPFKQGMLYVGSSDPLSESQLKDVQNLADAFSIAYARYEDFTQLEQAKNQIENTLAELKAAQEQLIHSEKMASLGELTAGIAHEIQNPLNFVNNFAEVSNELIAEVKEELVAGDLSEVKVLLTDLVENLEKINHHGMRASSIVKGMLAHSREHSGEKVPTDVNNLCEEYSGLAYHGMRAKNKSFEVNYELDLDKDLPKINLVPQDIGRVLLNLISNAFQAVQMPSKDEEYHPSVKIKTRAILGEGNNRHPFIQISVSDNGPGIPRAIRDKIFQPFFTTKTAGEGTGLGLSLSYDIVKAHGGSLYVDEATDAGSSFIIILPLG